MSDAVSPEAPARPGKNLRGAVLWTAGILLALGLAWFVGAVVVAPFWQARQTLNMVRVKKDYLVGFDKRHIPIVRTICWYIDGPAIDRRDSLCANLGGKEAAARKLGIYLSMPERLTPRRHEAIYVLSNCGRAGVRTLIKQLSDGAANTRCAAAWALGEIGPDASEAVPVLKRLLNDPDADTALAAKYALLAICPQR